MARYPEAVRRLIEAFLVLPGIGRKTAERFAFSLLQGQQGAARELAVAIADLHVGLAACQECGQFSDAAICALCADSRRDRSLLCLVAEGRDIFPIEQTGLYQGRYFVLGGLLNPLEGIAPAQLRLEALGGQVRAGVREIILALNATVEGDATALYLAKILKPLGVRITRLARGLPTGSRLEYADEATLADALSGRREVASGPPVMSGKSGKGG